MFNHPGSQWECGVMKTLRGSERDEEHRRPRSTSRAQALMILKEQKE